MIDHNNAPRGPPRETQGRAARDSNGGADGRGLSRSDNAPIKIVALISSSFFAASKLREDPSRLSRIVLVALNFAEFQWQGGGKARRVRRCAAVVKKRQVRPAYVYIFWIVFADFPIARLYFQKRASLARRSPRVPRRQDLRDEFPLRANAHIFSSRIRRDFSISDVTAKDGRATSRHVSK